MRFAERLSSVWGGYCFNPLIFTGGLVVSEWQWGVYTPITVQGTATARKRGGLKSPMCPPLASDLEGVLSVRLSCVLFLYLAP